MPDQRFPRLDRLTLRLTLGITVLVVGPVALSLSFLLYSHYSQTIVARRTAAHLENRILAVALRHQMLDRDERLMSEILAAVGEEPQVRRAMVLNHDGVIRHSSRQEEVGTRVGQESPTCLVCHSKDPDVRERWVILEGPDEDLLRNVLPIDNRPECHTCHDPQDEFNGILILDISLSGTQARFNSDAAGMAVTTGVLVLILVVGAALLVRHLILLRLNRLGRTARSIAGGNLGERATVEGDDVIAFLAEDFNNMADSTSALVEVVRERERQMTGVLNSLDDGLVVLDRDLRVVAANRSISRRLRSYPETLQGQSCREAVCHSLPCERDADCPTARCLSTGETQRTVYRLPEDGDAEGRIHEVYSSPVYSDDGSVDQVVEVWRDITERVREEEHLAEIERLSSLGVLASGLSHQVNTPLASTLACAESILGRLEGAEEALDPDTPGRIRESARIIRDQVLRCRKITDQFLRFARGIPPSVEPLDLKEIVQRIISLAEPTATEGDIRIELLDHDAVPLVTANTEVVQHVVLNLLVNAIESFEGVGGTVQVEFRVGSDIRLQIRDTGCGIPAEFRRHLFEPFRTRKPRGTGLGLFLSRKFMRRFGGDVRLVESVEGQGSCIEVLFSMGEGLPA